MLETVAVLFGMLALILLVLGVIFFFKKGEKPKKLCLCFCGTSIMAWGFFYLVVSLIK